MGRTFDSSLYDVGYCSCCLILRQIKPTLLLDLRWNRHWYTNNTLCHKVFFKRLSQENGTKRNNQIRKFSLRKA